MSDLKDINGAEELLLVSALRLERANLVELRAIAERGLARGNERYLKPAARWEVELATLDGLLEKLPDWFRQVVSA